ncbi:hypothetical protein J4734_17170 [Klebsiella pneumoniae]|uniref:Uncharacterized protein n=1 Tax=Klebsiella pneumoniae TaxID=573 RepID=A0A939SSJ1_KLEPN|nr:hypothetical protein [Klebsiella pneumoniae]
MAQGAHRAASRRRPVPRAGQQNRRYAVPSTYPCRLRVGPRQRPCKHGLSPHPCGLPRPSGNVSAILRPSAPAVSATMVNKLTAGRTNRMPGKAAPPGIKAAPCLVIARRRCCAAGPGTYGRMP